MNKISVRFTKDSSGGVFKTGDIIEFSPEQAEVSVKEGYAEYIAKSTKNLTNHEAMFNLPKDEPLDMEEMNKLLSRLKEGDVHTKRFLKVGDGNLHFDKKHPEGEYEDKAAFESEFQNKLYNPEDFKQWPRWGICGREYLVLIDSDDQRIYDELSRVLPRTFEVTSPRRGLPHKYFIVPGKMQGKTPLEVQNGHLHIEGIYENNDPTKLKALGEIRAQNNYLVAPGTIIRYQDKQTGEWKNGKYTVSQDHKIALIEYADFMEAIKPFFGTTTKQGLKKDQIENGIPEGERSTVLFQIACSFASIKKDGEYLSRQYVKDAVTVSAYRCKPPFDDLTEIDRMVDNAIGYRVGWEKETLQKEQAKQTLLKIGNSNTSTNEQQPQTQETEAISITDLNPILVAKKIMQLHSFIVEEDTELLYVYDEKEGIYTLDTESIIKGEMCKLLDNYTRNRFYTDIELWIKYNPATQKVTLNPNPNLLAVKNGVLNLKDRTLIAFDPKYYLTCKIPHNFNAEKRNGKTESFLGEIMNEKHKLQHQEFMGKTLYRKAIHQVAPVLNGEGNNGKSVLIDVDTFLLGKNNVTNVTFQALTYDKFASADLKDKMANFCADMPAEALKHLGMVKMIITSDSITSQKKHKDPFTWTPNLSMMFSCNHAPEIDVSEDNIGTFRRFMMWDFPHVYSPTDPIYKEDKHLRDKLLTEEEAEVYLNYCLDGLDRILKQGDYSARDTVQETRKTYIKKSNGCQAFTDEAIEVTNDPEDWFFTDAAYRLYAGYCQREKMPVMPKAKLSKAIEQFCNGAERFKRRPIGEKMGTPLSAWRYVKLRELKDIPSEQPKEQRGLTSFGEQPKNSLPVPSVPTVPPFQTSSQLSKNGNKLEVVEQSEQSEQKTNFSSDSKVKTWKGPASTKLLDATNIMKDFCNQAPVEVGGCRRPVWFVKDIPGGEKCECGALAVSKELVSPSYDVLRRCTQCYEKLKLDYSGAEWRPAYPDLSEGREE